MLLTDCTVDGRTDILHQGVSQDPAFLSRQDQRNGARIRKTIAQVTGPVGEALDLKLGRGRSSHPKRAWLVALHRHEQATTFFRKPACRRPIRKEPSLMSSPSTDSQETACEALTTSGHPVLDGRAMVVVEMRNAPRGDEIDRCGLKLFELPPPCHRLPAQIAVRGSAK